MSAQQADILTSELHDWSPLSTVSSRSIAGIWLLSRGIREGAEITWRRSTSRTRWEAARAKLYDAQAKNLTGQAR